MEQYKTFPCPCGNGDVLGKISNSRDNPGRVYYACPASKPSGPGWGCRYFRWEDMLRMCPCGHGYCSAWKKSRGVLYKCPIDVFERQSAAIRAIRDMEIERLFTALRLLKSNMSKEQLQTPLLQFFEENLSNLTVSTTKKDGRIVVKQKDKDCDLSIKTVDGGNTISSFLQHMSTAMPSFGGFEFSSKPGKTSFIGAENLQIKDFVLEEPSDTHALGIEDYLRTPGVTSQRLSVGMTPKTLRVPKQGEMLVSVHGSPLGVFKENNMDAIHEIEEE